MLSNFGLLNRQNTPGNVEAFADANGFMTSGGFAINVEGDLANAGSSNDADSLSGLAFGNRATNSTLVDVATFIPGTLIVTLIGTANVANTMNRQEFDSVVTARAAGDAVMNTRVAGSVVASRVSTSGKLIQAQATGNLGTSITEVDATNLETTRLASVSVATVDAPFSVHSRQVLSGQISASQFDNPTVPTQWPTS